jgi:hypothetical protein
LLLGGLLLCGSSAGSGEAVGHEREAEKVQGLALVSDAVGAAEPEAVREDLGTMLQLGILNLPGPPH